MAEETSQQEQFNEEEFLQQLKNVKDLVAQNDTPAGHGAIGEVLYRTQQEKYQKEAIPELQIAADAGIAAAKTYLGDAYLKGCGVEKDIPKAMDLFYDAALDGDVNAMYTIGASYFTGTDIDVDYEKALDFLAEAASKGSDRAMNTLGLMYLGGFGTEQNIPKAKRLFNKAMERGNVQAKKNLDMIKAEGRRFDWHQFLLYSFAQKEDETKEE